MADDARSDAGRPLSAPRAHRRGAVHELGFADWAHFRSPIGSVHRSAFEENRRDDVVTSVEVGKELVEQVAMARVIRCAIPEVMMGVDDRQGWVEGGFLRLPCQ